MVSGGILNEQQLLGKFRTSPLKFILLRIKA